MHSPVLEDSEIEDFVETIETKEVKNYKDSDACHKNDIVMDEGVRGILIQKIYFVCPICETEYSSKRSLGIHLKDTIEIDHGWSPKTITKFLDKYPGVIRHEKIEKADIYYFVVEPKEIFPLPSSVEIDLSKQIDKETVPPTVQEREKHDREVLRWRTKMMDTSKRPEIVPTKGHEAGFETPGPSGNYWFWRPEIWKQDQWLGITDLDLPTWKESKHRTLQLWVICPVE